MSLISHEFAQYSAVLKELTRKDDLYFEEFVRVTSVLMKYWPEELTIGEYAVMTFIVGRTLLFRKRAETISKHHFVDGIVSMDGTRVCHGTGMAYSSTRVAITGLVDKGYVSIHAFLAGKTETIPRVYEVNIDRILVGKDIEGVGDMLNRARNTRKSGSERGAEIQQTPCRNPAHLTSLLRKDNTSSKEEVPEAAAPGVAGLFKTPKRGRVVRDANDCIPTKTAKEVAQATIAKAEATRATRSADTSVPTKRWDIRTLQALLDTARAAAGVSLPRILVTTKPIGVLHKRLLAAEVGNVVEFFTWALQNWNIVANANRKAKASQMRNTKTTTSEMSLIPNFNDLAYRTPYILAFFNDRKYTQVQAKQASQAQRQQAEQYTQATEQATAVRRAAVRRQDEARKRLDDEAEAKRRVRRNQPTRQIMDDDVIPEFVAKEWGEA